jgi:PhoH-like ATPase
MSRKTFVIDTNVFIHDPDALTKFGENDVVVPLTVIEELDSLKKGRDELGANARAVIRYFDSLRDLGVGDLHEGVTTPEGTHLRIVLDKKEPPPGFTLSASHSNDNKILMVAYSLAQEGIPTTFVSKDLAARVKARALGIPAEDYRNLRAAYEELYRGVRTIKSDQPFMDQLRKDGRIEMANTKLFANEYCVFEGPEGQLVGKFDAKAGKVVLIPSQDRDIWGIKPLNLEQRCALDLLLRDDIKLVTLVGQAGTGKTLLAIACALKKTFDDDIYGRILVSRPIVPLGKDIGYLPGTKEEKLFHWMQPIYDNMSYLCDSTGGKGNETLRWILDSDKIELEAVTYIRGRTLPRVYVIIDEAQNLSPHEVKTIISRAGNGAKVVLTGDPTQIDNPYLDKDSNGLTYTVNRFKEHAIAGHVFLSQTERSELAALAANIM